MVNAACVASVRLTGTVMDPRRQSWLVLYQARSEAHKVWIVRRLRGIPLAASECKVVRPHGN